jgi:arylsulfatase A-like enzyme
LILHWPGRLAPRRVAEPVHQVDLAPTILAAVGVEASGPIQGRSLWPIDGTVGPSPVVVTRSVYPEDVDSPIADRSERHAIVDYPWKLILSELPDGSRRIELYRLDDDPRERHDRSAAETERVRTLAAAIDRLLVEQRAARASFAAQHAQRRPPPAREASRELLERLRSLGYVR